MGHFGRRLIRWPGAARQTAEHLARTALVTLAHTGPRHEPARVRAALDHVHAQNLAARAERRAAAP
jgi:hypothetical protein